MSLLRYQGTRRRPISHTNLCGEVVCGKQRNTDTVIITQQQP